MMKMKSVLIMAAAILLLGLTAFGAAPSPDTNKVKKLVIELCRQRGVISKLGINKTCTMKLQNIRTTAIDEKLKRTKAKAEVLAIFMGSPMVYNITYIVEYTTDGKLYVTVKGKITKSGFVGNKDNKDNKDTKKINKYGVNPNERYGNIKIKIIELFRKNMADFPDLDKLKWKVYCAKVEMYDTIFEVEITEPGGIKAYGYVWYYRFHKSIRKRNSDQYSRIMSKLRGYKDIIKVVVTKVRDFILERECLELFLETGHKYPIDNNVYQKWLQKKKSAKTERILKELQSKVKQLAIKFITVTPDNSRTDSNIIHVKLEINSKDFIIKYDYYNKSFDYSSLNSAFTSLRDRKVVPFSKIIEKRAAEFAKTYSKRGEVSPKTEFETYQEYRQRQMKADKAQKSKAYADLAKDGGLTDIYEVYLSKRKKSYCDYNVENKTLTLNIKNYSDKLLPIIQESRLKIINICNYQLKVVKRLGGISYTMFICNTTISEAKSIKKKLGNTWKVKNIKIWLKYDYRERKWISLKLFALPSGPKQNHIKASSIIQPVSHAKISLNITPINMKFVYVAPGSFQMGSNSGFKDEKPVHKVTISKGYWIGKYEVTQKEYQAVMGTNPSHFKVTNKPVEMVSWNDAVEFCKRLTAYERAAGRLPKDCEYCLPTEAEWEFAARGGVKSKAYKYSGSDDLSKVAWSFHKNSNSTHQVGNKDANELGIHDMSGNVYEWCSDWYDTCTPVKDSPIVNASEGSSKVVRGGGWCVTAEYCRPSYRYKHLPSSAWKRVGFRVVKTTSNKK